MTSATIEYRGVGKEFATPGGSSRPALLDFDLSVRGGELLCLLGPSGCGKSTVLNMTAGFEPCTKGEILVNGRPVGAPGPERSVVFQEAMLFPWLSVIDNVTFGPRIVIFASVA